MNEKKHILHTVQYDSNSDCKFGGDVVVAIVSGGDIQLRILNFSIHTYYTHTERECGDRQQKVYDTFVCLLMNMNAFDFPIECSSLSLWFHLFQYSNLIFHTTKSRFCVLYKSFSNHPFYLIGRSLLPIIFIVLIRRRARAHLIIVCVLIL